MLNYEQYRLQIKIPHFSSVNNGPQMITFQILPDILPSRVHVAIYLWFDSDSSALQHVMVCCWIWQCTTASVCMNNECLLINDNQKSVCQYGFNNTVGPVSCHQVMYGRFRSTCMSQHSQRSEWQNTGCHRKLETYLVVIFRHCVKRDPNNQIWLGSPIYSPAMLIKSLRYRHESSSYHARKEVPLFTSADQILTRYGGARYRK